MSIPNFKVGDIVSYSSNIGHRDESAYEIVRLMPSDGPEPAYRLRNVVEPRERVAREHELQPLRGTVAELSAERQPGGRLFARHERRR